MSSTGSERLRRSNTDRAGITRRRRGKGWSFRDADGQPVDVATRERVAHLAVPPAWRDVWICPHPNGHIQAFGTDDAGRRQYLYHERWRLERDEAKHDRVLRLAKKLPRVRETLEADLRRPGLARDRVLAVGLRMLDHGVLRVGGEQYEREHGTRGVATLNRGDVRIHGDTVVCEVLTKGGVERIVAITDPVLAKAVSAIRRGRTGSRRLLVWRDGRGYHDVHADDLNDRFKELAGDDFTVKDLRTWQATVVAAVELAMVVLPGKATAQRRVEKQAMAEVAEYLGNTATIARNSYVDPRVVEGFEEEHTIERSLDRQGVDDLDDLNDLPTRAAVERSVVRLLTRR
ncbi:MAG TPA: DNA topoisomerase IB [Segeticoccus sp.]|nr:DNA topoisomerase IB [Segeticoccus sp.]